MPRYKRTLEEAELDIPLEPELPPEDVETRTKLRNMWEFASLMQYIFLFGHVVKIDENFDIEDLEFECLRPAPSEKLAQIGLALLKYVSSHRGLTPDIFDEYARRQYVAKAPSRNPFGEEEEPAKFNEFDIFTRIRVLQQLSTWTLGNADRIRSMMPQEEDHLNWRMEPLGWDREDRAYFVLDDNRLYRRTEEPPPPPTPKMKPKSKSSKSSKSRGTRASKRRKIEDTSDEEPEVDADAEPGAPEDTLMTNGEHAEPKEQAGFGFTSKTWECVAITLDEYQDFLATIFRSRDPNEKQLRKRIEEDVLPIIEKRAEALRQKELKKQREEENLHKLLTAKRSSRIADKAEKEKQEREEREADEKRQRDLKMAHEEQERQRRIEEGHESRRLTREQRLKEREVKRILHEEELAKLEEQADRALSQDPASESAADDSKRASERQIKTKREQHKRELDKLAEDEDKWYFDCVICGMHGENLDDGTHSIACERCNVWQHSECHGFSPKQAEKDGFHFICSTCKRKEADAKKPKIPPLKLSKSKLSASPEAQKTSSRPPTANGPKASKLPDHVARQLDGPYYHPPTPTTSPFSHIANGPNLSPYGQSPGPPGYHYPPVGNFAPRPPPPPQHPWQGSPLPPPVRPPSSGYASSPPPPMVNGYRSPSHQQQHQYVHHTAVVSSGAHPGYQAPYQTQLYSYSRGSPGGMYPMGQRPPQHHQYYQQPPPNYHQYPPNQQQAPTQRPGSGHMMNGFQSSVKGGPQPSTSPPQHPPQPSYGHHQAPQQPTPQRLTHSPNTNFPPPANTYAQHTAQSPVKSSSPSAHGQQPTHQRPPQPPAYLAQTPQAFRPPSSNGLQPNHHTPGPQNHPSPASANANGIAADGMSGPWPEGSKAIPQKHDQSPVPPASSHTIGETKVVPPMAPLVPSPNQQVLAAVQSVPVKKMPGVNGMLNQPPPPVQPPSPGMQGADVQTMREVNRMAPVSQHALLTLPEGIQNESGEKKPDVKGTPPLSTMPIEQQHQPPPPAVPAATQN